MGTSHRQRRIADLLRLASQDKPVEDRFRNLESLVSIRGGLGKQTKRAVRAFLDLIRASADSQFERGEITEEVLRSIADRIEKIDDKLMETSYARRARLQRRKAEKELIEGKEAEIRAAGTPVPPGPAYPGFKWRYRIDGGRVQWQMVEA